MLQATPNHDGKERPSDERPPPLLRAPCRTGRSGAGAGPGWAPRRGRNRARWRGRSVRTRDQSWGGPLNDNIIKRLSHTARNTRNLSGTREGLCLQSASRLFLFFGKFNLTPPPIVPVLSTILQYNREWHEKGGAMKEWTEGRTDPQR